MTQITSSNIKLIIATGSIILGLIGGLLGSASISKGMYTELKDNFETHESNQQVDELREEHRLTKIETILEQQVVLLKEIKEELKK
jgi:hypothetical protein